ncbi:MAG: ABC transporter substrate-binding protein [Proteobacteria bacterium]|nr:ABC transporter substrate-binding protein [Pseudomonadota bacterium]
MRHNAFLPLAAALLAVPAVALTPGQARAQAADPALEVVRALDAGLIATMKAGAGAGQAGRARIIAPVVDRTFDLALMARLSVGPAWTGFSAKDQAALVSAFRAMTVAQYAHNFDGFSGESFAVVPQVETRGLDKLVRTTLNIPGKSGEQLNYRLRQDGGQWKIIDVYYRNAISQLATRRADFAGVVAHGGAPALIAHLNKLAASPK